MDKGKFFAGMVAILGLALMLLSGAEGFAAEKLKYATSVRLNIAYDFPALAAAEQGLWQKNGLDGQWVPFQSGPVMFRAVSAGEIKIGATSTAALLQAIVPGVPILAVAELYPIEDWVIVVRGGSPIKTPRDLKGLKLGLTRRGGIQYAFGLAIARALNMEKDIKLVTVGGPPEVRGALMAGVVDAIVENDLRVAERVRKGEDRIIYSSVEFLPKDWLTHVLWAHKDFIKSNPDTVRKVIRTILQAVEFINTNPAWMQAKLKEIFNYSDETARKVYKELGYTKDGRFNLQGFENIRNFLIEYELVPKDKTPPLDKLYTAEFVK